MHKYFIFTLLLTSCLCTPRVLQEDTYQKIKSEATWESYDIEENPFKNHTLEQLKALLGAKLNFDGSNLSLLTDNDDHSIELPQEFDSRTQWADCVMPVRNQDRCGSCWAFSAAEVLGDRWCIATQGQVKRILSPQDMVSCDSNDMGCQGGRLDFAWNYLEKTGIVTDTCFPYVSGDGQTVPHCPHGTCQNGEAFTKFRAKEGSSRAFTCPTQIKAEIMKNGPIQTGFIVYEDFMHYKSGVYKHVSGRQLGGHAVKIVGWGHENGQNYWIAQNSWTASWGEKGFFKIAEGECGFDQNAYAGLVNANDFSPKFLFFH